MALVVEMPRLSDTMGKEPSSPGSKRGTRSRRENYNEVETDKAVMEFEAEEDGVLRKVLMEAKIGSDRYADCHYRGSR